MIQRVSDELVDEVERRLLNKELFDGIKTGFEDLDRITDGFANGELIIVGGRPAMGKTSFAYSLIDNVCVKDGKSCIYFTAEMSMKKTLERIFQIHGDMKLDEQDAIMNADTIKEYAKEVKKAKLWIEDSCIDNPWEFIDNCSLLGAEERIDLIIIDYVQLLEGYTGQLNAMLLKLKELAKELHCPIVVFSQLSRAVEYRSDHTPGISDLPEAGIMEPAADEVLFLYRPAYYGCDEDPGITEVIVAKPKRGRWTNAKLGYNSSVKINLF